MGHDSRKARSRSEAPSRSRTHRSGGSTHQQPDSQWMYVPSRLSQVTNAGDLSEAEAHAEASRRASSSTQTRQYVPPNLSFDNLGEWMGQGGRLDMLDDKTQAALLHQYLQSERLSGEKSKKKSAKKMPPPSAPILEEEESDEGGGVSLTASSSHRKDKGKGKAR